MEGYPFEVPLPPGLAVSGVVPVDQVRSLDWRARNASLSAERRRTRSFWMSWLAWSRWSRSRVARPPGADRHWKLRAAPRELSWERKASRPGRPGCGIAARAARGDRASAAQLLRDQFARPERLRVDEKSASDFVSSADLRSQEIIRRALSGAYPAYAQLLEEGTSDGPAGPPGAPRFIVDPLDGTTNFLHGIPHFAVSIALEKDGEVAAGVVHDVAKGENFACEKGQGAWLGTRQIRSSPERQLSRSVVGTGNPHHGKPHHRPYVTALAAIMPAVAGVRRMGSLPPSTSPTWRPAATTPSSSSASRRGTSPPASLLVREAGGIVTRVDGRPTGIDSGDILASSSPSLHRNMVDWLAPLHGVASRPVR